jgi:hypothetical protein
MTVWKQAFVLGGAVLLLAACDRATGPSTQLQKSDAASANLIFRLPGATVPTSTTTSTTSEPVPGVGEICRTGYNVSSGRVEMSASCIDGIIDQ